MFPTWFSLREFDRRERLRAGRAALRDRQSRGRPDLKARMVQDG